MCNVEELENAAPELVAALLANSAFRLQLQAPEDIQPAHFQDNTMRNSAAQEADLLVAIRQQVGRGGIVLLHGPAGCGKTWTIEQLFKAEAILDRKEEALISPASFAITLSARDLWNATTHPGIAVDEANIFSEAQLKAIVVEALATHKGIVVSLQNKHRVLDVLTALARSHQVDILEVEYFNRCAANPNLVVKWRLHAYS